MDNNRKLTVITAEEAVNVIKAAGYTTMSLPHLKAGIDAGVYPFGARIPMKNNRYEIYKTLLDKWISERSE